ncbi:MAG: SDR family NAD(P)-dependent oxidoreductase [Ardenticatenaceae bacterium]|nr:SDR family NAD(P)-dependent oxidoreductase [Ardenticatenaceae bacterium]
MTHTVLITGATSGIGLAMSRLFLDHGDRLILVGRRPLAQLDQSLFNHENYCRCDLADPTASENIAHWLKERGIEQLDLLIHNAALGWYGDFPQQPAASIAALVQVNLKTPIALTHRLLPLLKGGKVVFVSSVASVLPTADYAVYTATKAALDGFARSAAVELAGQVEIQVLHPGATNTGMHAKIGISQESMDWDRFPSPEQVAAQMMAAMRGRRRNVAIGFSNKLLRLTGRLAPSLLRSMMRKNKDAPSPWAEKKRILVTGAADGIGRALAEQLAAAGHVVLGVDIDPVKGRETAQAIQESGGHFEFAALDLTDFEALKAWSTHLTQPIDVVIHNAGISAAGRFADLPLGRQLNVIDLNFTAPMQLTAVLASQNKLNSGSQLIFLSSLSKFVGYPGAAVYAASKDGLASYAVSLHAAARQGMRTSVVYPGPTRTVHARRYSPDNSREERRMSPDQVATAIINGMRRHRPTIIPGAAANLFAWLGYFFPRLMEGAMKRTILDKIPEGEVRV